MDWDDVRQHTPASAIAIGEDLSGLSIAELEHRIGELEAEVAAVSQVVDRDSDATAAPVNGDSASQPPRPEVLTRLELGARDAARS